MKFQNQCYMKIKSTLETDIFNYKTPEFFINMKDIPDKKSSERKAFVLEEKRKCREGININGVYIPGGLYFHLNYYHLQGDDLKTGKKTIMLPRLRDNEWIFFNDYDEALAKKLIYTFFGLRQAGKSENIVSLCLRELSVFKETEALALFSRSPDKDTFVKKMSTAITHGEKFIIVPTIDKDWNKDEIRFGFTKQDNTTELRGRLYIYNTQEGKKIQMGSGKSPSFILMDEIAINPFRSVYDVVEPALLSDAGGLRCTPIFTFTGGEAEKAKDAENFVKYPSKVKQFVTTLDNGSEVGGRFLTGLYRKDCKELSTISKFTGKKTNTWLDNYPIYLSDFDIAKSRIDAEKEDALKSPDKSTYLLKRIFFPLTLEDVFLTESNNRFPVEVIRQHQEWLREHYQPICTELYRDIQGKVQWKYSDLKPINKFPVSPTDDKDAPFLIFEHPIPNAPKFTYCIGIDPINASDSNDKVVSLFTIKVYKRMLSPLDEFKDTVVASYRGRPRELQEAHELALMVAEYYNAVEGVLPEASESSLFQYFFLKKKGHFLADSFDLVSEINIKTKFKGKKGLPPTVANQKHYMNIMVEDANQEIIELNEEGDEVLSYGVTKLRDVMLLEEMKEYKSKSGNGVHDGNFDSIVSYGCALTLAKYYDIKYPLTSFAPKKQENVQQHQSKYVHTPFGSINKSSNNFAFGAKGSSPLPRWMRK